MFQKFFSITRTIFSSVGRSEKFGNKMTFSQFNMRYPVGEEYVLSASLEQQIALSYQGNNPVYSQRTFYVRRMQHVLDTFLYY